MTGLEAIAMATNKIVQWINKKFESCDADTLDGYHAEHFIMKDNVDLSLDEASENPVQNRTIATAVGKLAEDIDAIVVPTKLSEFENDTNYLTTETDPTVPSWAKAAQKPTYTADEVGADSKGSAENALTNAQSYTDTKISELINGAPTTLDTLSEIATAMAEDKNVVSALEAAIGNKADEDHTHNYAGSAGAGGAADSANKLNANAGSATQPVYFINGIPVAVTYALNATVPADAKFTDTTYSVATQSANGLMSATDKRTLDNVNTYVGNTSVSSQIQTAIADKANSSHNHSAAHITSGTLTVERGGTGQTTGNAALKSFFAAGITVLSSHQYGDELPSAGTPGRIFFKKV